MYLSNYLLRLCSDEYSFVAYYRQIPFFLAVHCIHTSDTSAITWVEQLYAFSFISYSQILVQCKKIILFIHSFLKFLYYFVLYLYISAFSKYCFKTARYCNHEKTGYAQEYKACHPNTSGTLPSSLFVVNRL